MRGLRQTVTVGAAALALLLAACDQAQAPAEAAPQPKKVAGRIVVLPDSAIVVQAGSTEEQLAQYLASQLPAPRTFRFTGTEFEPWSARPNIATQRTMYATLQILRAYPKTHVKLVGYTDSDGTVAQNQVLANQRVDRWEEMLINGGIDRRRIVKEGRGATDYIATNTTEAGRARNRRIELTVTAK
jgi:OmpA-OmpF porin, OOP family